MTTERRTEREFGIHNVTKDRFANLDYLNDLDNQEKFEDYPNKLFTYEECERFIVHQIDKENLTILNVLQPKYLLAFQLDLIRKNYHDKKQKEMEDYKKKKNEEFQKVASQKNAILQSKQTFFNDLITWENRLNSTQTQISGQFGEINRQKPNSASYNLKNSDFTPEELSQLKRKYDIVI